MTDRNWRSGFLAIIAGALVAGCLPEVSEPTARAPAEAFPNAPPQITGIPAATATVGIRWQFQPAASDPDGDALNFSATGLPGWAGIDSATGLVSGTPRPEDAGATATIIVTVSDGEHAASLQAFQVGVVAASPAPPVPANTLPTISGAPPTEAQADSRYSFAPSASDAETPLQLLRFSVANLPSWASFNTVTGMLSGTPGADDAGLYRDIVITVRDAAGATASLPAFTISVTASSHSGSATLSWTPPTEYTDGSALGGAQLEAFRIYYGTSSSSLSRLAEVDTATTSFTARSLGSGNHYFAVTAVSTSGMESDFSELGTKTLP